MPTRSKSPKRATRSKSPKRKTMRSKSPKMKRVTSKSPKRKTMRSKSPKRKTMRTKSRSVSRKRMVTKKPVAKAMMDGVEQKPEVVSMMAPLPAPGMIVGAAVADTVDAMKVPKRATRSKSPKKTKTRSKSPKKTKTRSKSPKRAASPRKVKVLAFGMMPAETAPAAKPMSPRRMSKTKSM